MPSPSLRIRSETPFAGAIRRLDGPAALAAIPDLVEILVDCVAGGASIGFMDPLSRDEARRYWEDVATKAATGAVAIFVAEAVDGSAGTVQLGLEQMPNQQHRADLRKLLVHRRARRLGIGAALMRAAEAEARAEGRTLLCLDTATGEGGVEAFYDRLGWTSAGVIPDYALWPDGRFCDTRLYYKRLTSEILR